MRIHPTVVIGLGSTGKYVIANIEKYLYEVLSAEQLDIFRFIVLETAPDSGHDATSSPISSTSPIDIKPHDLGAAWRGLKMALGKDFDWCPERLNIGNQMPGAGNMRAGGRLMFLASMELVHEVVSKAVHDVRAAAQNIHVNDQLNRLLKDRGLPPMANPLTTNPTFLVIGTLAGGTCSGACVDLAYLLARIQPTATREAVFVFPDDTAISTYKENSWAALQDILYFTAHQKAYHVEWLNSAQSPVRYSTSVKPEPPFSHVYLVTQKDMHGGLDLAYTPSPTSPLLKMVGLFTTANLLGLHDLRQARLVDLNTRVGPEPIHQVFLTHTVRGVSYPKYELSEAAACRVIATSICDSWLSPEVYLSNGSPQHLQQEEIRQRGRDTWNREAPPTWAGLRDAVNIPELTRRIVEGEVADVSNELVRTFADQSARTIYSLVAQNVDARVAVFKQDLRKAFAITVQEVQNFQYAEWYLAGLQGEIERTRRYWEQLDVPHGSNDLAAWKSFVRTMVEDLRTRMSALGVKAVREKRSLIADDLGEMLSRLEMFLMFRKLEQLQAWVSDDLQQRLERARKSVLEVRKIALNRAQVIERELNDQSGPLLKISRSADRRFQDEINDLAKWQPAIPGADFVRFAEGDFEGLLPFKLQTQSGEDYELFNALRTRVQPPLMQQLQRDGTIDIVREIERQGFTTPAIQRATTTDGLSIATTQPLMTGQANVPAYVMARSAQTANDLMMLLRRTNPAVPNLSAQALPLLDHMALFYQEGGKMGPEVLRDTEDFRLLYEKERQRNATILDPLRLLRSEDVTSPTGAAG